MLSLHCLIFYKKLMIYLNIIDAFIINYSNYVYKV